MRTTSPHRPSRTDPYWDTPEKTRRHVAMLWGDLQRAVTAEVGSALVRQVTDWTIDDFTPRIVVGEPRDFDAASPDDEPYGWLPLAVAHCREAGWDFSPKEESGTWIGWFEPGGCMGRRQCSRQRRAECFHRRP